MRSGAAPKQRVDNSLLGSDVSSKKLPASLAREESSTDDNSDSLGESVIEADALRHLTDIWTI